MKMIFFRFQVCLPVFAIDDGNDIVTFNADKGLVPAGTRCVLGLHLDNHLDRFIPIDKFNSTQSQAWMKKRF